MTALLRDVIRSLGTYAQVPWFCIACSDIGVTTRTETAGALVVDEGEAVSTALDVVVIIDQSGSMTAPGAEIDTLVVDTVPDALEGMADYPALDWRLGVRPARESGDVFGWVSDDSALSQAQVGWWLLSGVDQSEAGLGSAVVSMTWDDIRPAADLHYLVISDEPDQSQWATAQSYRAYSQTYKSNPWGVSMTAIVYRDADELGCAGLNGELGAGYIEAADYLYSLCEPDLWASAITDAARSAARRNVVWYLSAIPLNPDAMEVLVAGQVIPRESWLYSAAGNFVELLDLEPEPGERVSVVYVVADS